MVYWKSPLLQPTCVRPWPVTWAAGFGNSEAYTQASQSKLGLSAEWLQPWPGGVAVVGTSHVPAAANLSPALD